MVHPGCVSCYILMEKSISLMSMMFQMLLTNQLPCTLLIIGQLPWDPSGTHFPIPKVTMDSIVHTAVTRVEFYSNFVNSDSPVVTDLLLDLLFHCLSCHANWSPTPVFVTDVLSSVLKSFQIFHTLSPDSNNWLVLNRYSSVDFRRFHTLWPQKMNNVSLLFHGASWWWSGHVVRAIAQAHTAQSSWPLYDILLRSHFMSQNKVFRCAYFSMHFRIKFLSLNDFPSYIQSGLVLERWRMHYIWHHTMSLMHWLLQSLNWHTVDNVKQMTVKYKYLKKIMHYSSIVNDAMIVGTTFPPYHQYRLQSAEGGGAVWPYLPVC